MIKPTNNNVLIQEIPSSRTTSGGIMLPDIAQHIHPEYLVIAAGPRADEAVKPGERVVLDQFRINSKVQAGEGLWLVADSAISVVIPA